VGVQHERLYRYAGAMATRMLLLSNSVSVLMPGYRKILNDKYGRDNVHLRAHGILARRPEFPDFSRRGNPTQNILAFGKWGTYKRLELMMEAFDLLADRMPNAKLIVAGGDHPQAHGYTNLIRQLCAENPRVEFRGYIPEDELADLFQSSSVAVMPYSSSTGCSGVAHLACAYGVPIVCSDLPDFRQMAAGEELAIDFFPPGDAQGLADCLVQLLENSEKQQTMATQNFSAALRMTMPNVVQKYLRHFEVQQRVQTLRYVSRFRRLPQWIPSKSLLLRFMTRNSLSWARRSAVLYTGWSGYAEPRSLNGDGDGRGKLNGSGSAADGDGVCLPARTGGVDGANRFSAAGTGNDNHDGQSTTPHNGHQPLPLNFADPHNSYQPEAEQPASEKEIPSFAAIRSNGSGNNGQDGSGATFSGSDGSRSKRTA
jgi:glycosyl transferase family 1